MSSYQESGILPRPMTVRDGPPPPRIASAVEQESWISPHYRKSAKLQPIGQRLPWPAEIHRAMSLPRRYHDAFLNPAKRDLDQHPEVTKPAADFVPASDINRRRSQRQSQAGSSAAPTARYLTSTYAGSTLVGGSVRGGPSRGSMRGPGSSAPTSPVDMLQFDARGEPVMSPQMQTDLAAPPLTGMLRHMRSPRPDSSISNASRRQTSPQLSREDQMLLQQYEQSLLAKSNPGYAAAQAQAQSQSQAQAQVPAAYSSTHPGVAVPPPALHRAPSHAPSMNYRPPSIVPAGNATVQYYQPRAAAYGAVPTMSISGVSQGAKPARKPTYQPYEQWADHDYFHELEMDRSQRGILCCCCE